MKKILFITPSKAIGGTNSSLASLISYLSPKCKIDILLLSSDGTGQYEFLRNAYTNRLLDAYYTRFEYLDWKTKFIACIIKVLKRCHIPIQNIINKYVAYKYQKKYSYDIVVGYSEGNSMRLASAFNTKLKYTWIHCEYDRAIPITVNELSYYEKFHKIVCVSKYTMKCFLNRYPSLDNITISVYNLIDTNRILSLSSGMINDQIFNSKDYSIISVGRMHPVKQFSKIPQIAYSLRSKNLIFKWFIIGGPINDEYRLIESEIEKYRVAEFVVLLGPKSNPYPYFKKADLYVATSKSEACPMVFIEAKLLGIPIISTDFASAYEFISNDSQITTIDKIADLIYDNYENQCIHKNLTSDIVDTDITEKRKIDKLFLD